MKKKTLVLAVVAMGFAAPALAQYTFKGSKVDDVAAFVKENKDGEEGLNNRIELTAGEDSVSIGRGHVSTYQMGLENKDYKDAYISWKWLMENAPYSVTGIYKGNAPFMFFQLIKGTQDQAMKTKYFNDMMDMFQKRQDRLAALNNMEKRDNLRSTLGDVLAVKAEYYNWTAPEVQSAGYTLNKSYDNFEAAIKAINEGGGREVSGSFLQTYFMVSDAIYKANDKKDANGKSVSNPWREQYLQDYLDSKDACDKMLNLAKEAEAAGDSAKAQKLVTMYSNPQLYIEQTFAASGAADREQIIDIYTKKFDTYKNDIDKLNAALNLMAANDCDDAPIYYQYAKAAYDIKPSYNAAIGLAQKAYADKNAQTSLGYYNKALELATNDNQRGSICLKIAKALGAGSKSTEYVNKAIDYNPDLKGRAYMQMANNYVKAGDLNEAISYCNKAAAADITVAPRANELHNRLVAAQAKQRANAAELARAQAKYNAWKKAQAEEEAFWKGGK